MAAVASIAVRALQLNFRNVPSFLSAKCRVFSNGLRGFRTTGCRKWSMFLKTPPEVKDGLLSFNGTPALVGVPENVVLTSLEDSSAFLGASCSGSKSRHVFKIGAFENVRFLSLFRFKIWWMIPRTGKCAREVPVETQMLLLETVNYGNSIELNNNADYVLFLPILDGEFRSSLQGNSASELLVCVESGDSSVTGSEFLKSVFINIGENPYELIRDSIKTLHKYTGTFTLRDMKQIPGMLDVFGWCTWDAFYQDVNAQGIRDGLKTLSEGGTPVKLLIIDDGWQDTANEFRKEGEPFIEGSQFGARLMSILENEKFRRTANENSKSIPQSLKDFVSEIKESFGLKYVYVWHALMGYWGGLHPSSPGTKKYNPTLKFPTQSPGNLAHQRDIAMDCMEKYGVGVVDPDKIYDFYDDLHRYLVTQGVDGVKVDVQNLPETLAGGCGGRVSLTRRHQEMLEKSVFNNFSDNSIICCMAHNSDTVYSSKKSAVTRASDDYYPNNPQAQTVHIATVAYNSLFFGEVFVPDWDMFYSLHEAAEFHSVARAVGGCGIYVSDKPGKHDFKILKRLVLPDGSVLRAKYPGRPSRDCLFSDPVSDGRSLLKIWNLNNVTGVVAIFNCQGAGSWPGLKDRHPETSLELSGHVSPVDVEFITEISPDPSAQFAVFSFKTGSLSKLPLTGKVHVTLKTLECDAFTISPIKVYDHRVHFAPIGLINMYNIGGAVTTVDSIAGGIQITGRGQGVFGGYSSVEPKSCTVNAKEVEFQFNNQDHLLTVDVPKGTNSWDITLIY